MTYKWLIAGTNIPRLALPQCIWLALWANIVYWPWGFILLLFVWRVLTMWWCPCCTWALAILLRIFHQIVEAWGESSSIELLLVSKLLLFIWMNLLVSRRVKCWLLLGYGRPEWMWSLHLVAWPRSLHRSHWIWGSSYTLIFRRWTLSWLVIILWTRNHRVSSILAYIRLI